MKDVMKIGLPLAALVCGLGLGAGAAHAQELHWYRGNTHTHTINSEGAEDPAVDVAFWYRKHGYQFLFITEHNYLTDVAPVNALAGRRDWFLVLPGEEVDVRLDRKEGGPGQLHFNTFFATKGIGPNKADTTTMKDAIAPALAQGALVQFNHPNWRWSLKPADFDDAPDGSFLEIWTRTGGNNSLGGDDGKGDVRPSLEGLWDYLLSQGKVIWGTAGDDTHVVKRNSLLGNEQDGGKAWIVVRAPELTPAAIRTAMTKGDFYTSTGVTLADISSDANSFTVTMSDSPAQPRYRTRFIGQGGKVLAEVAGPQPSYRFKGDETYVRASIMDSNDKRAWTQPVFRDGRDRKRQP